MDTPSRPLRKIDHLTRYLNDTAQRNGYHVGEAYWERVARVSGFPSFGAFQTRLERRFRKLGVARNHIQQWSDKDWSALLVGVKRRRRAKKRRQPRMKLPNKKLSLLIQSRLLELGKSQYWLAQKLRISKQAVHQYIRGSAFPRGPVLLRLCKILGETLQRTNEQAPRLKPTAEELFASTLSTENTTVSNGKKKTANVHEKALAA